MDVILTTWDGAGNTPPVLSVARALRERGHEVRVMGDPSLREDVAAAGLWFMPWSRTPARQARGAAGDVIRDWECPDPMGALAQLRDRLAIGAAGLVAQDVLEECERQRPDVLLTEMFLFGALVAAEARGIPAVVLNPTICVVPRPGVPPFGPGFLPATTDEERRLHDQVAAGGAAVWNEALPALNRARADVGLPPLDHVLEQYRSAARTLLLTSEAFDLPGDLPPGMEYVGPRLDDPAWSEPWPGLPGDDPLVLLSFSSDFQDHVPVLRRAVEALGTLPVRGVVTTGWGVEPAELPAPPNVAVLRSAPHSQVLAQAAAVLTHAGHGTTIRALAAGVPVVCVPLGRDQLDVAARVVHAGAGLRVDPHAPVEELSAAVRAVLEQPTYRAAARRIARAIAQEVAEDRAVTAVEQLLRPAQPAGATSS